MFRNPHGYAVLLTPVDPLSKTGGEDTGRYKKIEFDTFKCGHCQKIVHVKPRCAPADAGGYCQKCDSLICPRCSTPGMTCAPWEKVMDEFEARQAALRSYEI